MENRIAGFSFAALLATGAYPTQAQDLTPINVSYQPALYWALPFYLATEMGWWADVGLDPSFSTFPAGAPQIEADDWDVGGTGSVPAVLGAAGFGLKTVGITNDESAANALMAHNEIIEDLRADPAAIAGRSILVSTNSTADYAVQACLRMWGVDIGSVEFVHLAQAQIISAMIARDGDLAGVWAPNTYTLQERADSDYLCSGADAGATVPGALVVRPDFAAESPELVARFLAVYLRGWAWAGRTPRRPGRCSSTSTPRTGSRSRTRRSRRSSTAPDLRPRGAAGDPRPHGRTLRGRCLADRDRRVHDRSRDARRQSRARRLHRPELHADGDGRPRSEGLRHARGLRLGRHLAERSGMALVERVNGMREPVSRHFPGLLLCGTIAAAATFLSDHYGGPAMLFALLLGIAFNFAAEEGKAKAGVEFASKFVLRLGVGLLGIRITMGEIAAFGWQTPAVVAALIALTMATGFVAAWTSGGSGASR
jgi:ABC-type nitrate/sulfonate/bicarbonate transport system substrate-binding protein